jgi:hypothetical protein
MKKMFDYVSYMNAEVSFTWNSPFFFFNLLITNMVRHLFLRIVYKLLITGIYLYHLHIHIPIFISCTSAKVCGVTGQD